MSPSPECISPCLSSEPTHIIILVFYTYVSFKRGRILLSIVLPTTILPGRPRLLSDPVGRIPVPCASNTDSGQLDHGLYDRIHVYGSVIETSRRVKL